MSRSLSTPRRRSGVTGRFPPGGGRSDSSASGGQGSGNGNSGKSAGFSLSSQYIVAMPGMADSNFSGAVVLIAEHNERGALGLIVNKPSSLTLHNLLERIEIASEPRSQDWDRLQLPVFIGGPVQTDRGFVLHEAGRRYDSTVSVSDGISLTTSKDVLEEVAQGKGPDRYLVTLGYAGWGPGQLEDELAGNAWLSVPGDADLVFEVPAEERFAAAYRLLGIDPAHLALVAGHA